MNENQFSQTHLDHIREVMFGKQKQANVINDAVVAIIARFLSASCGLSNAASNEEVVGAIKSILQGYASGKTQLVAENNDVLCLIAGEQSFANLTGTDPLEIIVEQPNPENSPKYIFRIVKANGNNEEISHVNPGDGLPYVVSTETTSTESESSTARRATETFQDYADRLRDLILPVVPTGVKTEVSDPYAQALVCAETYFRYISGE